jgi:hypothetical protein
MTTTHEPATPASRLMASELGLVGIFLTAVFAGEVPTEALWPCVALLSAYAAFRSFVKVCR